MAIGFVKSGIFRGKKFKGFNFSLFDGLLFEQWYEFIDGRLLEFNLREFSLSNEEYTERKSIERKAKKSRKLLKAREFSPEALLNYYIKKNHSVVNYIRHPEIAYMTAFVEYGMKYLVLDNLKGLFCANLLYINKNSKVTAITKSEYFILKQMEYKVNKTEIFTELNDKYDTFFILGNCDILKTVEFYKRFFYRVLIYVPMHIYARNIFMHMLLSSDYVDVCMCDFFFREYQTNDNIHPFVKADLGGGYVIKATRVNNKENEPCEPFYGMQNIS